MIEADETFVNLSFKGNHGKGSFARVFGRRAHYRGGEIHTRGTSKEKVCIPCAIDRSRVSVAVPACLDNPETIEAVNRALEERIDPDFTLVTDGAGAYRRFAKKQNLRLIQAARKESRTGEYNVQRINSYHSSLDAFLAPFKSVATKYLKHYLNWYVTLGSFKESIAEHQSYVTDDILVTDFVATYRDILCLPAIPFPVTKTVVKKKAV